MDNGMERRAYESEIASTRLGGSYGSASKHRLKALRQSAVSGTAVRGATRGDAKSAENTTGRAGWSETEQKRSKYEIERAPSARARLPTGQTNKINPNN